MEYLIKLLLSRKLILIASLVLILLANTTNLTFPNAVDEKTIKDWVNTAEATESNDKKVCEDYNGKWKSIGNGNRGCTFENDDDAERYGFRPGFSLDSTSGDAEYGIEDLVTYDNEGNKVYPKIPKHLEEETPQQVCEDTSGEWKDGTCKFSKQEIKDGYDVDFDHSMEEIMG